MSKFKKLSSAILSSDSGQDDLHEAYDDLSLDELESLSEVKIEKAIEHYDVLNYHNYLKTEDGKLLSTHPDMYAYDPHKTAFEKNNRKNNKYFYAYQKKFIEDWSVSDQELVILYYGVGSGKTAVAVNCAEQYQEITKNAHVYFILPASLVLGTIKEMYERGIDAKRKNSKGDYIYYFISYQQLLGSKFDFKDNSLLIIDEAHNLRNIISAELSSVSNAVRWPDTGDFSLIGNKLSQKLIMTKATILRTIMMTGTLFVNGEKDIDSLISIGYKKPPLLNIEKVGFDILNNADDKLFKIYYEGLIGYYRLSETDPRFPKKKFNIINIPSPDVEPVSENDEYFRTTRTQGTEEKMEWIFNFLETQREEKTLIYSQFKTAKIKPLLKQLAAKGFRVGYISGELDQIDKLNVVGEYNRGEMDVLIFTLSIKEGISFKLTDNIIVIEPYWNYAIMEQILARGIRANSHPLGQQSTINIYFLVATVPKTELLTKPWFDYANKTMNGDIKKLFFKEHRKIIKVKSDSVSSKENYFTKLFNTNKNKVTDVLENAIINYNKLQFTDTKTVIKVKDFGPFSNSYDSRDIDLFNRMFKKQEEINVFEDKLLSLPNFDKIKNPFIEKYTKALQKLDKHPSILQELAIKKRIYAEMHDIAIQKINNTIFKESNDILGESESILLFGKSKLLQETREKIKILCPFSGTGACPAKLLNISIASRLTIDVIEDNAVLFKNLDKLYGKISNVNCYDVNIINYYNKYNYDYIFSLIPSSRRIVQFKINTAIHIKNTYTYYKPEIVLVHDIDYIVKLYNLLNNEGILALIVSSDFLDKTTVKVKNFKHYLEFMNKMDKTSVSITKISSSKSCLIMKKLNGFIIKVGSIVRIKNTENKNETEKLKMKTKPKTKTSKKLNI